MGLIVKPSDLYYKYPKDIQRRDNPKFRGKPDPAPFNRDDLYEVIPMLTAVMEELDSREERVLHLLEELMNRDLPRFLTAREEVFDFLVACSREKLADWRR